MDETVEQRPTSRWKTIGLSLVGFIIFGLLIYFSGWRSLDRVIRPDPLWLAGGMVGIVLMLLVFSLRWGALANRLAEQKVASAFEYYLYTLTSLAVGTLVPQTAGVIAVRSAALARLNKISLTKSVAAVLLDKLFDGFYALMFAWPVLLLIFGIANPEQVFIISLAEFAVVSILATRYYSTWLRSIHFLINLGIRVIHAVPVLRRFEKLRVIERLQNLTERDVLSQSATTQAYWFTALGQVLIILRSWMIARAVGLDVSIITIFVGVAMAQASLIIAITPGGLGITESGWYIALFSAGVSPTDIATFLIAHRLFQTITITVTWLVIYLIALFKTKREESSQPSAS